MSTSPPSPKLANPKGKKIALLILGIVGFSLLIHIASVNPLAALLLLGLSGGIIYYAAAEFNKPSTRVNQLLAGSLLLTLGGLAGEWSLPNGEQRTFQPQASAPTPPQINVEIVATEDQSNKVLPGRLSDYSYNELAQAPMSKRMAYRIVVKTPITNAQVLPMLNELAQRFQAEDPDIDAMTFWLWSDEKLLYRGPDIGQATWAPQGEIGNITPDIASSNDRTGYDLHLEVRDDLGQYLKQRLKQETTLGYSEGQRREIWKAMIAGEALADKQASQHYPTRDDIRPSTQLNKQQGLKWQLREKYATQVRKKYHLTESQDEAITHEALEEGWPNQ